MSLVVDEIGGGEMGPQLEVPVDIEGIVLIVDVIDAVELAETVGVIEPTQPRHQVIAQGAGIALYAPDGRILCGDPSLIVCACDRGIFLKHITSSSS